MDNKKTSAAGLYERMQSDRDPFLQKARQCALVTIPHLFPPQGHTGSTVLPTPWQGMGARGLNNLSSRLLLTMFPANAPFFKMEISDFELQKLAGQDGMRAKVDEALNRIERAVMTEIETNALRVGIFEGLKQLLVSGNVLFYLIPEGGIKVIHLDDYVVRRDCSGNVLDIVSKERSAKALLPESVQQSLWGDEKPSSPSSADKDKDEVSIYTHIHRKDGKWKVYQEIEGKKVPKSEGSYPIDKSPWIPVRFTKLNGEAYGRSYVEEYLGDLQSLEGLSQAIVEGSAAAAKVLFLVNPNGTTTMSDVSEAENGAFREGVATDITVLQLQKYNDFRVAKETMGGIEERLAFAFLLNSAVQRSGERVTAEEIRYMATELEAALGGIYSILSQELQLPLTKRLMYQMEEAGQLPMLPKGAVSPAIVTGIEALGRGNDLNRLKEFLSTIGAIPEAASMVNWNDALKRIGTAIGIDMAGLIKTEEQIAQEAQQAQMMQAAQALGPNAINQVGNIAKQGMQNAQAAEQAAPQQ